MRTKAAGFGQGRLKHFFKPVCLVFIVPDFRAATRTAENTVDADVFIAGGIRKSAVLFADCIGRPPMVAHAHPYPAQHKKLRHRRCFTHRADLQQFGQRIGAVEYPHPCIRHGFENLAPPLVHQMRRAEHQGTTQTGLMRDRCGRNGHHGLAGAHFSIDHRRRLILHQQQLIHRANHLTLGIKQLPRQAVHNCLMSRVNLPGVERPVLFGNSVEQTVTEIG